MARAKFTCKRRSARRRRNQGVMLFQQFMKDTLSLETSDCPQDRFRMCSSQVEGAEVIGPGHSNVFLVAMNSAVVRCIGRLFADPAPTEVRDWPAYARHLRVETRSVRIQVVRGDNVCECTRNHVVRC